MPFLDAQGRILGRWSAVRAAFTASAGALGIAAYLWLAHPAYVRRMAGTLHDEDPVRAVRVELLPLLPALTPLVEPGDVQANPAGRVRAEVLSKQARPSAGLCVEPGRLPAEVCTVTLRLDAKLRGNGAYTFGEYLIKPGEWFRFEPDRYALEGLILAVTPEPRDDGPGLGR